MIQISKTESRGEGNVIVIFCVRNEKFRLSFFLDYYRQLGVTQFYAVDNNSDDGTKEYLVNQKDVTLYFTDASYKSSNAGRDWTSRIANEYCAGEWCLTVDVDEFYVFPHIESVGLNGLTDYLDSQGHEGMAAVFLDFYSSKPLSKTDYTEGQSTFEVCEYFDLPESYNCYSVETFPFFEIKGGPRRREFWKDKGSRAGPSMRKVPLIKWKKGFEYLVAAHSCTPIRLADVGGVVAHFKMLSHFKQFAADEVSRNERVSNSIDWKVYAKTLGKNDINFFDERLSYKYQDSYSLLESSHMFASKRFDRFAQETILKTGTESTSTKKYLEISAKRASNIYVEPCVKLNNFVSMWGSLSLYSQYTIEDSSAQQTIKRLEALVDKAARSRLWRYSYRLRKFASKLGLTDQRSLTEENYSNQSLQSKFTFVYDSIWWDLLGPFRVIEKILMRIGWLQRSD